MSENSPGNHDIHVGIGGVKVGTPPAVLKAILGSCVGIGFLVPSRSIYGLAHCFLPSGPEENSLGSGKFVTSAVPSLLHLLGMTKYDAPLIEAVVAGGASMYGHQPHSTQKVGELNAKMALEVLNEYKIKIIHQDLGLFHGRQIIIDCSSGKFFIRNLQTNE